MSSKVENRLESRGGEEMKSSVEELVLVMK